MIANESRPGEAAVENSAVAAGSDIDSIADQLLRGQIKSSDLPFTAWQIWCDGFRCAQAKLQHEIDALNREADRLWFELRNPAEARAEVAETLRIIDGATKRMRDEADTRTMRALEHVDPVEYRRLALLRLTDLSAFQAAIDRIREEVGA